MYLLVVIITHNQDQTYALEVIVFCFSWSSPLLGRFYFEVYDLNPKTDFNAFTSYWKPILETILLSSWCRERDFGVPNRKCNPMERKTPCSRHTKQYELIVLNKKRRIGLRGLVIQKTK